MMKLMIIMWIITIVLFINAKWLMPRTLTDEEWTDFYVFETVPNRISISVLISFISIVVSILITIITIVRW